MSGPASHGSIPVETLDNLADFLSKNMAIRAMKPYVAKILIDRWDTLTEQQRQKRVLEMPQECYLCGVGGTDEVTFAPDPAVGYTKLYCSKCCLSSLLQGFDDEDDEEDEAFYEDPSVGGASQPVPSTPHAPHPPPR
jgi:hypothetical protein